MKLKLYTEYDFIMQKILFYVFLQYQKRPLKKS